MDHKYFGIPDSKFETFDFQSLDFKELDKALDLGIQEAKKTFSKFQGLLKQQTLKILFLLLKPLMKI